LQVTKIVYRVGLVRRPVSGCAVQTRSVFGATGLLAAERGYGKAPLPTEFGCRGASKTAHYRA
jgi:hypothetical protein